MSRKWIVRRVTTSVIGTLLLAGCSQTVPSTSSVPDIARVSLIPAPLALSRAEGVFTITPQTRVAFTPGAAEQTASYFVDLLRRTRNVALIASREARNDGIVFELVPRAGAVAEEAYSLSVSPERIAVSASDPRGLFYGAVTLWQLATTTFSDEIEIPALKISDAPRFRWRGLMLDSARHYQSPAFIRKLLDVMALHKLNVLHWHLVDDQGWRLEIKKYPKLTTVGAWRLPAGPAAAADIDPATGKPRLYGGFYSQAQVRELVEYAAARQITIVPEIEMPGHASAAIAAYPHLGVSDASPARAPLSMPPSDWGVYPNLFNVEETTFTFLEDVLRETVALFPGEYIHIGGDEAVKDQWRASASTQRRMHELGLADEHALQSWFIRRIEKFLHAQGRRLIGWDEILEGGLAPHATVMSWRGIDGAIAAATAGHDAVLSPAPTLYFDHRPFATRHPGRGRIVSVADVYRFDPAPAALPEAQRRHVLGVQANIWTEHIRTEERLEYMAFPRAAALAEVAWSPAARIDWDSFSARLPAQLDRYAALGVGFARNPEPRNTEGTHRTSYDLEPCSENLVLSLEDDAPLRGDRATYLVDIMNPCWIYPQVALSAPITLQIAVGHIPFNFQIGADIEKIPLRAPAGRDGELEVRLDTCAGERLATWPLGSAVNTDAVTRLAPARIEARSGRHDLCFLFTRGGIDPMWLLESVAISPASAAPR